MVLTESRRWEGEGDTARRGAYRSVRGKKGSKRAKKYVRSRTRSDVGIPRPRNAAKIGSNNAASRQSIMAQKSRSDINAKKHSKAWQAAWIVYGALQDLKVSMPETLKMTALYLGEEHGLLATDTARILDAMLYNEDKNKKTILVVSLHMIRRWFREAGMGQKQRMAAKRLHRKKGLTAVQICQDFQSRGEKTPLSAIVNWIAALKK